MDCVEFESETFSLQTESSNLTLAIWELAARIRTDTVCSLALVAVTLLSDRETVKVSWGKLYPKQLGWVKCRVEPLRVYTAFCRLPEQESMFVSSRSDVETFYRHKLALFCEIFASVKS